MSFGAYYRYNPERGDFHNFGTEWLDDGPHTERNIYTGTRARSHLAAVYYENTFGGKYMLHFDGDYKNSRAANNANTVYPAGDISNVNSDDINKSTLLAGKLYLSFPLAKGDFTAGTQNSYTRTTLDYRMLNPEISQYIPSTFTEARQTSAALFASWERTFGKFSLTAGVRYEYVDYRFEKNGIKYDVTSRKDNFLTPDIALGYTFGENSQISLSYKMATEKPPYSQLTGGLTYAGIHEIEGGNPALKDGHMHDVQLFGQWKSFMVQADYTRSLDTYAYIKRLYPAPTLQLLMQPVNIDVSALNIYIIWSRAIKIWTPEITVGVYKQWIETCGNRYNRPIFSYYFDNTVSLPSGFFITLNASGSSKGDMHTNHFETTWFTLDVSAGKTFFNGSLQLKLSATDIFNTQNNDWTMNTCGIFVDKRQSYDRRGISFTATYRFRPHKSKYKGRAAAEAEMNRL